MMRGASADALAALTDEVRSVRVLADAESLGQDLFAVAALVRSDPALRRMATDASLPAEVKQDVVRELLGGRVQERSLELVADAVARRWTSQRDLADALERLSEVAHVRSVGAKAGQLADELFGVAQMLKQHPDLRDALANRSRSVADRAALVEKLLDGKVLPATVILVRQALTGTYRTVAAALAVYRDVAADVAGERVATVHVAEPMREADRARLQQALTQQYGQEVHLNEVVDPSLLGGVRVEIGSDVIDGTVTSRIDEARRRLAG